MPIGPNSYGGTTSQYQYPALDVPSTSSSRVVWTHTGHVDGQTLFSLPSIPTGQVEMEINGVDYRTPFISVASNIITWSGSFTLSANDAITFSYV